MEFLPRIFNSISDIDIQQWSEIEDPDSPFADWEFFHCLEQSGSIGATQGQVPIYFTLWQAEQLVAAAPLFLKEHSYGEFIFDWSWAEAAQRAGIDYYPKLVGYTPFTPASSHKLLGKHSQELLEALQRFAGSAPAHSLHFLFTQATEQAALTPPLLARQSYQYHWHNDNYTSFGDFLTGLKSRKAKQFKKERQALQHLEIEQLGADQLTAEDGKAFYPFYLQTIEEKGSIPYLTPHFFELLFEKMRHRLLLVRARENGKVIAEALYLFKGKRLFGRYWGSLRHIDYLHFELAYYQGMEFAIQNQLAVFEAGAQGEHKLLRGFRPVPIFSAHHFNHPGLQAAVRQFLIQERPMVEQQMQKLATHLPFKSSEGL
jgi:uncharacterized protein